MPPTHVPHTATGTAPPPRRRCAERRRGREMGATTQKLSTAEIRQLVLQAGDYHFDESVNRHFHFPRDFDRNRYRAYLQDAGIRIQARPEDLLASLDAGTGRGGNLAPARRRPVLRSGPTTLREGKPTALPTRNPEEPFLDGSL